MDDQYAQILLQVKSVAIDKGWISQVSAFFKDFDVWLFANKLLMARVDIHPEVKHSIQAKNNFASLYGGASVIERNSGAMNAKAILDDNQEKYMANKCETKSKFIVISLKEDININGFAMINSEFYSSNVKDIAVYGSNEYPIEVDDWVHLGSFKMQNIYEWQQQPLKTMWARYVRFEFLSHHGNEYYCTVTQIKVFGSPILADFKKDFMTKTKKKALVTDNGKVAAIPIESVSSKADTTAVNQDANIASASQEDSSTDNTTKWDVFKALQLAHSKHISQNKNDWRQSNKILQCDPEEAAQTLEQEEQDRSQQSIFTILTMNINEIRSFIERQIDSNVKFEQKINYYKSELSECKSNKSATDEMARQQNEQIEELKKSFQTYGIMLIVCFFIVIVFVCIQGGRWFTLTPSDRPARVKQQQR